MIKARVALRVSSAMGTYGLILRHGDDQAEFRLPRVPVREHGNWRAGSTAYILTEDEYGELTK